MHRKEDGKNPSFQPRKSLESKKEVLHKEEEKINPSIFSDHSSTGDPNCP